MRAAALLYHFDCGWRGDGFGFNFDHSPFVRGAIDNGWGLQEIVSQMIFAFGRMQQPAYALREQLRLTFRTYICFNWSVKSRHWGTRA
jgi:hypothetical protein